MGEVGFYCRGGCFFLYHCYRLSDVFFSFSFFIYLRPLGGFWGARVCILSYRQRHWYRHGHGH